MERIDQVDNLDSVIDRISGLAALLEVAEDTEERLFAHLVPLGHEILALQIPRLRAVRDAIAAEREAA